jgi:MFS family permease
MSSEANPYRGPAAPLEAQPAPTGDAQRLGDLTAAQWKSGLAAWLGWLFDGLDMHLYTLVALPFVAHLLGATRDDPAVGWHSSLIQAAFMVGWAVGGTLFGRVGDLVGRSRALMFTILTYALFTGLSFFAATWWHLLIFRFLAALGIGGEWAVGASLLSETWPKGWRPWMAAVLQTAVNLGSLLAGAAAYGMAAVPLRDVFPAAILPDYLAAELPVRSVFLIGVLPALLVLWIRRAVPEPDEWRAARERVDHDRAHLRRPGIADLFAGPLRRVTLLTTAVCSLSLTGHWAFMFWYLQHLQHLPLVASWAQEARQQYVGVALIVVMIASIVGNFVAAGLARRFGYRPAIVGMCLFYAASMFTAYFAQRGHREMLLFIAPVGLAQGVFGLFTMYLPPLFPPLIRTTGAGFCYNIGRLAAAAGIVYFGTFSVSTDPGFHRLSLLYASFLFVPAAAVAMFLPEPE